MDTKEPNQPSWKKLEVPFKDRFLRVKVAFFISAANEDEPFLRLFQLQKPLAQFIYDEVGNILMNI